MIKKTQLILKNKSQLNYIKDGFVFCLPPSPGIADFLHYPPVCQFDFLKKVQSTHENHNLCYQMLMYFDCDFETKNQILVMILHGFFVQK